MDIKSTREAVSHSLLKLAENNEKIVLVSPDSMLAARTSNFKEKYPKRFIEVGISEQGAVDVAAGLATAGMIPVVITYAGFLTMRACEMIRTFIAYPGLNVKFVGLNGGMLGGEREGVTHQFYEDIGILRSMAGVKIICPADATMAELATEELVNDFGPAYLRLGSGREPIVYSEMPKKVGDGLFLATDYGSDAAIFASGFIMNRAITAANTLEKQGIHTKVIDVTTIKPIDKATVATFIKETGCAVTVEDHNIYGGLGSAICEVACENFPAPVVRVGLNDCYPQSGVANDLLDKYGLSVEDIVGAVKKAISAKK